MILRRYHEQKVEKVEEQKVVIPEVIKKEKKQKPSKK
jgi:hypothetical protein